MQTDKPMSGVHAFTVLSLASNATEESFYVDDCLAEANSVEMAIRLQREL